ncbi:MAG: adenosylmethionine decarboxylase [Thermoprotei archaeon]|nr:MAG: adenosylmethionine decarboxylase [Thermoprotei archaeon]
MKGVLRLEGIVPRGEEKVEKLVVGHHYYGELYGCNPEKLSDPVYIENIIREAACIGNFTLLDVKVWKISPGISAIGIVLESHISIHTWPEYEFATVDVYTCGDRSNPRDAFMYIVEALEAKYYNLRYSDRSY